MRMSGMKAMMFLSQMAAQLKITESLKILGAHRSDNEPTWYPKFNYWGGRERTRRVNKYNMSPSIVAQMENLGGRKKKNFIKNFLNGVQTA